VASVTASTTPTTPPANKAAEGAIALAPAQGAANEASIATADEGRADPPHTGSLARRMMLIAAGWIAILLLLGGIALDRTIASLLTQQFDERLEYIQTAMVASAEIGPDGEVYFNRALGDQRFLEPYSGMYWQISGEGQEDYPSRSLWDRTLQLREGGFHAEPVIYDSNQFEGESLRIVQRSVLLPGSETQWQFAVGGARAELDGQIAEIRAILIWSFAALGLGLLTMAGLQTWYGLGPLRRVRLAIKRIRTAGSNRVTDPLPLEVQPMVEELNALLAHSEKQAEEARTHAGNLAHALKTPLTVIMNAATAEAPDLGGTVMREAGVMRRQVDHHLARARAVGRRSGGLARAEVRNTAMAVERAVGRLYPDARLDMDGPREVCVAMERQDLEEVLGNLIENAAKYGGGSVFVTIDAEPEAAQCEILVEDDGRGIPLDQRERIFARGTRLDTDKPGTGLGLAIVRDVVEIYGGSVSLGESEDLGGLLVRVSLPRAAAG
jgi:signal transduction histidine kinase